MPTCVLYDNILLGWDQETVTPDGKKLLTDTPAAIEAATVVPEDHEGVRSAGHIGFNWNECQTTFMQGRAAMWWDGIGFSAPLLDKTKSQGGRQGRLRPDPAGPKAHNARPSSTASAFRPPRRTRSRRGCSCNGSPASRC